MHTTIIALGSDGLSKAVRCQLRAAGYAVLESDSALEAGIAARAANGPALVIREIPNAHTAVESLKSFRDERLTASVPFLMMCRSREEMPPEVESLQPFSILVVPCRSASLLREIQYLLTRSSRRATDRGSWFGIDADPLEKEGVGPARWKDARMKAIWSAPEGDSPGSEPGAVQPGPLPTA